MTTTKKIFLPLLASGVLFTSSSLPANAAFSVATEIIAPASITQLLANNTASAIAPVALGLTAISAFGYVMKRFLFSA